MVDIDPTLVFFFGAREDVASVIARDEEDDTSALGLGIDGGFESGDPCGSDRAGGKTVMLVGIVGVRIVEVALGEIAVEIGQEAVDDGRIGFKFPATFEPIVKNFGDHGSFVALASLFFDDRSKSRDLMGSPAHLLGGSGDIFLEEMEEA